MTSHHRDPTPRSGILRDGLFVFLILLLCYTYFLPKTGDRDWVANSRAALTYAIVDQGVLHIDAYHHHTTGDKAFYNGHYYTIASIGPSLAALPAYAVFKALVCAPPVDARLGQCPTPGSPHPARYADWALIWVTFFAVSLPSAALAVLVYRLLLELAGSRHAFALALLYGLATVAFPYSRAFFQHQLAAFGLAFGFYLLWRVVGRGANPAWLWLAGLLFGFAAISEYPLVLAIAFLFAWAVYALPHKARLLRLILGALPPLLAMAAYNFAIFGTPLPVAYRYHVFHQQLHTQGFMGLTTPSLEALYGITFSPLRGLFFISPFLLLMLPGPYWLWRERRLPRALVLALAAAIASFFAYNSAYLFWTGGASVGPRYLAPMLPLAMLPVALAFERGWRSRLGRLLLVLLAAASLLNVWAQTIAGQYYASTVVDGVERGNPLFEHALPLLLAGDIAQNYGHRLGLPGWWSLLPLGFGLCLLFGLRLWLTRAAHVSQHAPRPTRVTLS